MAKTCPVCENSERLAIEEALGRGSPYRELKEQFGLSIGAMRRHRKHLHLPSETASLALSGAEDGPQAKNTRLKRSRQPKRSYGGYEELLHAFGRGSGSEDPLRVRLPEPGRRCCACGMSERALENIHGKLKHRIRHDRFQNGVKLPENFPYEDVRDNILAVPVGARGPAARAAHAIAKVLQQAAHNTRCSFTPGNLEVSGSAYLYIAGDRVVGYMRTAECKCWARVEPGAACPETHEEARPMAALAFVAETWRGKSIGNRLVRKFASDCGIAPSEVVFRPPFSAEGLAGVLHFQRHTGILVGDARFQRSVSAGS